MEALYQQLAQLATSYAARTCQGQTLAEHEALCYIQVCRALESYVGYQAIVWARAMKELEKQIDEEKVREDKKYDH